MTGIAAALALVSALLYAVSSVAEQRAAFAVPDAQAVGLGLIRRLIRRKLWWAGIGTDAGGYFAQAAALAFGSLLLVQPLLVTTLLFALPLGARWAGRKLSWTTIAWAMLLAGSLAAFITVGSPNRGILQATPVQWLPAALVLAPILLGCVIAAAFRSGTSRALLLAVATGIDYGITAALTKSVVSLLDDGFALIFTSWETYALGVSVIVGAVLLQSAFQAGGLGATLPAVTVLEPIVSVAIGITVLEEHLEVTGATWFLIAGLVVVMVIATVALARSSARRAPA